MSKTLRHLPVRTRFGPVYYVDLTIDSRVPDLISILTVCVPCVVGAALTMVLWNVFPVILGSAFTIALAVVSYPHDGFTLGRRVWLRAGHPTRNTHGLVTQYAVAHELIHTWQWERGTLRMLWRIACAAMRPWWRRRDYEVEASAGELFLLSGQHSGILLPPWITPFSPIPRPKP